jgi:hypothetical protein
LSDCLPRAHAREKIFTNFAAGSAWRVARYGRLSRHQITTAITSNRAEYGEQYASLIAAEEARAQRGTSCIRLLPDEWIGYTVAGK